MPITIGQVGHVMIGVIDSAMVGRVGPTPLAASALANGLFFIMMVIGIGISYAISPLVAISQGSGDKSGISKILHQSLMINLCTGLILSGITFFGAGLIKYMNQPSDVVAYAVPYFRIISLSIIPVMVFQTYRQFLEGLGIVRPAMLINIFANVFHAFFNWVLIFGKFGIPAMELNGAGIATIISRILMALIIVAFVLKSRNFEQYGVKTFITAPDIGIIKKILGVGIPTSIQYFFEVSAFSIAAVMVGWINTVSLAAHQIALNLASITYMVVLGLSSAGAIRVGRYYGEKNQTGIRRAGFTVLFIAVLFMLISGLIFVLFRNYLPHFYVRDPLTIEIAAGLLIIAAFFQIFDGLQAVGLGILRGLTDAKIPTIITFIAYWVVGLPVAYLLGFTAGFGVDGIWIGLLSGLATSAFLLTLRFNSKSLKIFRKP